jgi:hypothetical protein
LFCEIGKRCQIARLVDLNKKIKKKQQQQQQKGGRGTLSNATEKQKRHCRCANVTLYISVSFSVK